MTRDYDKTVAWNGLFNSMITCLEVVEPCCSPQQVDFFWGEVFLYTSQREDASLARSRALSSSVLAGMAVRRILSLSVKGFPPITQVKMSSKELHALVWRGFLLSTKTC